ncbi:hypothetical protein [Arthrobacter sp. zg-Y750]|uniref:hypothetical protein n=1 Tax=Arthrobacter sp. zg-Y750 TaxID=2894189 RepID=UPI001E491DE9|nr:hypothetical protein [Arthrobacter sp. zg-Y750]MCC9177673.1 hypothetical protein [Arthrobacter sp. zg-Y750]
MNSPTQLATQIRFHLESIGENNAHHAFELLCLGLTRRRIVSNVIPATGPVSAGGDGGRDAESFWSIVARELPNTSLFTSLATEYAVVLAVTAQRENIPTKIKSDLAKIGGKGEPVDRVIYFTIRPVDTAKRHELQEHARSEYSMALDIWDAQAIANELASPDLFHLAVDFLHVPSSLAPEREESDDELPEWYREERDRWRSPSDLSGSMGEIVDLREGLRFSSLNPAARADLPDWLAAAHALRNAADGHPSVLNRVDYEIVIATGFGLNTLKPVDAILRGYFDRLASQPSDPGVLTDAITLLRLLQATLPGGGTTVTADEAEAWSAELERLLEAGLAAAAGSNAKAGLLAAAAILALGTPDVTLEELEEAAGPGPRLSDIHEKLSAAKREGRTLPAMPSDAELRDLEAGMRYLVDLVETLPEAPMVPLDDLMSIFDLTAPVLIDHPDFFKVRQALDNVTVQRSGQAAAGDRAQSRAMALLEGGRPVEALREIHSAKLNWLSGDTAEGAAIMMLLASAVYSDLGLPLAAKQYAMSAAMIAKSSGGPDLAVLMARGIILAATYEHQAGQWLTATQTFRIGIWAQAQLAGDPWSFERYPYFQAMLINQCLILRATAALRPALVPAIESVVKSTQLDQLVTPMLASVAHLDHPREDEIADTADRDGLGRPFSDAGPVREYTWGALGNVWIVTSPNDRAHVLAAERFVAAAQITLADLAGEDLLLTPGEIRVEVDVADQPVEPGSVFTPASGRSEGTLRHLVTLTRSGTGTAEAVQLEVASAALQVIVTQSLLGQRAFVDVMNRTYEHNLPNMLTCVRPYDELVDLHKDAFYDEICGLSDGLIGADKPRSPQPDARLRGKLPQHAAAYDHAMVLDAIAGRYETMRPPVRLTLQRLAKDQQFTEVMASLRAQGWKDWHLLLAVVNIVVNGRARRLGVNMNALTKDDMERVQGLLRAEERPDDPMPPADVFTEDVMWVHLANAAVATIRGWGLELRVRFEPRALLAVLGDRFNYWDDDVDHDPILSK